MNSGEEPEQSVHTAPGESKHIWGFLLWRPGLTPLLDRQILPFVSLPYGAYSFYFCGIYYHHKQLRTTDIYFSMKANGGNQNRTELFRNNTCGQEKIFALQQC